MLVIAPIDFAILQMVEDGLGMAGCKQDGFWVVILETSEPVAIEPPAQTLKTVRPGRTGVGTEPFIAHAKLARQQVIDRHMLGPIVAHDFTRIDAALLVSGGEIGNKAAHPVRRVVKHAGIIVAWTLRKRRIG